MFKYLQQNYGCKLTLWNDPEELFFNVFIYYISKDAFPGELEEIYTILEASSFGELQQKLDSFILTLNPEIHYMEKIQLRGPFNAL